MPETNRDEIAKLEALYASNPAGRVFTHLAEAYRKAGEYDRARAILDQGLSTHPGYASAYVVLGRVHLDLGDAEQATASFRRVLELDPHNLVALRSLGEVARSAGRTQEALGYFQELSHQEPNNPEIEGIIQSLKQAPAEPEVVAAPSAEAVLEESAVEQTGVAEPTAAETTAEPAFEEPEVEPAQTSSFQSGFEEYEAPSAEEPQPVTTTPEEALPTMAASELPQLDRPKPDITDLVAPDIDLDWGAGEPAQEALPGDLAAFASFPDINAPQEPPPEPPPVQLPTFEEPPLEQMPPEPTQFEPSPFEETSFQQSVTHETSFEESLKEASTFGPPPVEAAAEEPAEELAAAEPAPPVLTETMATLYRDQGLYDEAADVYRSLLRDRPFDADLQRKLDEVESLAAPEAPPPFEGLPAEADALPFLANAPEAAQEPAPQDDEIESPWMSGASTNASLPTPYAWTAEAQTQENEDGPAISDYFRSLLSWRPAVKSNGAAASAPEPEPEVSDFAPPVDAPDAGIILDLPVSEMQAPPAIPADAAMPWEAPASPSMPTAPVTPPPLPPRPAPRNPDNPVEAAFEEWFSGDPEPPAATPSAATTPAPAPPQPSLPLSGEGDGEDDDDLEMFRSWLQSLKK